MNTTEPRMTYLDLSERQMRMVGDAIAAIGGMPSHCDLRSRGSQVGGAFLRADSQTLLQLSREVDRDPQQQSLGYRQQLGWRKLANRLRRAAQLIAS